MKPTLLFATLSMVFAMPQAFAATELETLRTRCTQQELKIQHLEEQVQKLKAGPSDQSALAKTATGAGTATSKATTYTVRPGECIEGIARRSGCSPVKLAKANGLKSSSVIHPGQKLKLPGTAVDQAPAPANPTTHTAVESAAPTSDKTHKIQAGETYASISRKYRISTDSLVAANPDLKPTALRPGQVIRLSSSKPLATPAKASSTPPAASHASLASAPAPSSTPVVATKRPAPPAPLASPTPAAQKTPKVAPSAPVSTPAAPAKPPVELAASPSASPTPSPNPEKKIHSVTIEGEVTYGEFAATHGTDTSRLNDLNGLDLTNATVLAKGSELYVPAQP